MLSVIILNTFIASCQMFQTYRNVVNDCTFCMEKTIPFPRFHSQVKSKINKQWVNLFPAQKNTVSGTNKYYIRHKI